VCRAGLGAWLAWVISSDAQLTDSALNELLDLEAEGEDQLVARA
jgi:hypothetical protein